MFPFDDAIMPLWRVTLNTVIFLLSQLISYKIDLSNISADAKGSR